MWQGSALCTLRPTPHQASLPGDLRALEPPDPFPNSDVKRRIADGSVGFPHVRVGHRQASNQNALIGNGRGILLYAMNELGDWR